MTPAKRRDLERLRDWHAARLESFGIINPDSNADVAFVLRQIDASLTAYRELTAQLKED